MHQYLKPTLAVSFHGTGLKDAIDKYYIDETEETYVLIEKIYGT